MEILAAPLPPEPPPAPERPLGVRTDYGTLSKRRVWDVEVVDIVAVATQRPELLQLDRTAALKIRGDIDGCVLGGLRFFLREETVMRGKGR